jgi:hypothetical protein
MFFSGKCQELVFRIAARDGMPPTREKRSELAKKADSRFFLSGCCNSTKGLHFGRKQGDQIGRIFAHWAIACLGWFTENYKSRPNIGATCLPRCKICISFLQKNGLGYILGHFSQPHLVTLDVNLRVQLIEILDFYGTTT